MHLTDYVKAGPELTICRGEPLGGQRGRTQSRPFKVRASVPLIPRTVLNYPRYTQRDASNNLGPGVLPHCFIDLRDGSLQFFDLKV